MAIYLIIIPSGDIFAFGVLIHKTNIRAFRTLTIFYFRKYPVINHSFFHTFASMDNSFTKAERLNGRKEINSLFDNGNKMFSYPYRIFWRFVNVEQQEVPVRILISASKRSFKKAVDRNQIKRYIKEAYRTQKSILIEPLKDRKVQIAILYIEKEVKDHHFHEKAIKKLLNKLVQEVDVGE